MPTRTPALMTWLWITIKTKPTKPHCGLAVWETLLLQLVKKKLRKKKTHTRDETQLGSYFIFWRISVHGLVCKTEAVKCQRTPVTGVGALRYIGVHICEQKKLCGKGSFFAVECIKQGMHLGVWNTIFQEKGMVLSKFV